MESYGFAIEHDLQRYSINNSKYGFNYVSVASNAMSICDDYNASITWLVLQGINGRVWKTKLKLDKTWS